MPVPPVMEAVPRIASFCALPDEVDACKVSPPASVNEKETLTLDGLLMGGTLMETLAAPKGSTVPLPARLMPSFRSPDPLRVRLSEMEVVVWGAWPWSAAHSDK